MGKLPVLKAVLTPRAAGLMLDRLAETDGLVVVEAHCATEELACPDCSAVSRRVHSGYERHLTELPMGRRRVVVKLTARRFSFPRGRLTTTHARRTDPGADQQVRSGSAHGEVALASSGPGPGLGRTARCTAAPQPGNSHRPCGAARPAPGVAVPARAPQLLGIDDFAFGRASHTYGTLLVDVESTSCRTGMWRRSLTG
ncbi:transposase family protein [Streptomyces alanosinicus]|uniref:Transposase IS204/IS1001/IS1096/IS1165 zinc-finger domain-containing protein n=1 Tax=Streptomyces alanosinicus TaxID=68171 RepID=A0A918YND0_9ACTN|nr:hypothetical protein GCM10010339_60310 [Streptomyces alanosinicus]